MHEPFNNTATAGNTAAPSVPTRDQIDAEHLWDLSDLYPDTEKWQADLNRADQLLTRMLSFKGKVDDAAVLVDVLRCRDEASVVIERVYAYAMLRHHEDTDAREPQADYERARSLANRYSEKSSWLVPFLMTLPEEKVTNWIHSSDELAVYGHWWSDLIRQKKHVLSEGEERILALSGTISGGANQIYSLFTNADLKFPRIKDEKDREVELTQGRYSSAIYSSNRRYRRDAFLELHGTYRKYANSTAAMLGTQIKRDLFYAKARQYDGCLHASLEPNNIPVAVYEQLVEVINDNLPSLHHYTDMRRRILKLEELHAYDLYVSLAPDDAETVEYNDAVETIVEALGVLGDEYVQPMQAGFSSRWVDVYETRNKRSGAYCMGTYSVHPYLLMNYTRNANSRSTLAHEMGHAMHSWFTQHNQPPIYGDYTIFCAEVASTVNEVLLNEHLLRRAGTPAARAKLILESIENMRTTVFRQTMFAEFEKTAHELAERDEPLTPDTFFKTYRGLVEKYYGPALTIDDVLEAECLRIPHFYRNFYVYQYATSYCAATNIALRILAGEPGVVDGYLQFLKSGSSDYSINLLKLAGVDMASSTPFRDTMKRFATQLDELEELLPQAQSS